MPRPPLSNEKKFEIVRLWLIERLTYIEISKRTGVSTGAISEVINDFKAKAKELSLEEAARIYNVGDEVSQLLDLSEHLKRAGAAVSEAVEGAALLRRLKEMGVQIDDVESWIKLCQRMSQPDYPIKDFVPAAMRLSKLEGETGLDYGKLLSGYEMKLSELREVEAKIKALKGEVKDLEEKRSLANRLERQVSEAEKRLRIYRKSVSELEDRKRSIEEGLKYSMTEGEKAINVLSAKINELSKKLEALEGERRRLEEELAPKRKELAELNMKVADARLQHDSLAKKCGELEAEVSELQRKRDEYARDITNYKVEYERYMAMLEKVVAKLDGKELTLKELRDIVAETLADEAKKMADSMLAQWMRDGLVILVEEFSIDVTCPYCSKTFPLLVTRDFMARLVRGSGVLLKTPQLGPLPPIEIPRLPSPGSTTITCPSCDGLIEVTYENIVEELCRKTMKRKQ